MAMTIPRTKNVQIIPELKCALMKSTKIQQPM